MRVFNSLGSNYNFRFALRALLSTSSEPDKHNLQKFLGEKYQGSAIVVNKGREAIYLALQAARLPIGSSVAINGFTCYAVYEAIKAANLNIHYVDVEPNSLNFSALNLEQAIKANPKIKAVIIQNTLGFSCDIEAIAKICQQHQLILIEDLAHSIGARYGDGREAGTVGDFVVLSFSQDKMIDTVSGGAVIIRNPKFQDFKPPPFAQISGLQQLRDRLYPIFTWKIRTLYPIGLGKALHLGLKRMQLLSQPMGPGFSKAHDLQNWCATLVKKGFDTLDSNLYHRRQLAAIYHQNLSSAVKLHSLDITTSANLRYPIVVKNQTNLIKHLKNKGIHISDIWYDAPIAPAKYLHMTDYKHQCPNAEQLSETILNLPTHRNVSMPTANLIAHEVNQWFTSSEVERQK